MRKFLFCNFKIFKIFRFLIFNFLDVILAQKPRQKCSPSESDLSICSQQCRQIFASIDEIGPCIEQCLQQVQFHRLVHRHEYERRLRDASTKALDPSKLVFCTILDSQLVKSPKAATVKAEEKRRKRKKKHNTHHKRQRQIGKVQKATSSAEKTDEKSRIKDLQIQKTDEESRIKELKTVKVNESAVNGNESEVKVNKTHRNSLVFDRSSTADTVEHENHIGKSSSSEKSTELEKRNEKNRLLSRDISRKLIAKVANDHWWTRLIPGFRNALYFAANKLAKCNENEEQFGDFVKID